MQNLNNTQSSSNQTPPVLIDASSLGSFFMDVTEFLYEQQHGNGGTMTTKDIVLNTVIDADSDLVDAYSATLGLLIDLGWTELHAIGTTFDDELLYEFNPIELGVTHA